MNGLRSDILCGLLLIFSWFNAEIRAYLKHSSSAFRGLFVALLFLIQLGESMYVPPLLILNTYEAYNIINQPYHI